MKLVLLSVGIMLIAVAGIAVKLLLKKDGKFAGTCASNNPMLRDEGVSCSVCGARPEEQCKAED
ncbi:MAG TPA: membrane or secreted protein [Flavobacteriales bacterium]|nr:membrane or secreted protein [Flavobacteriales bacterium]HRE98226.1 membrane or secreted protein [Flavobacteriales bacterium]HRJ39075.1 membrane or secreted protein [Flavobacteriales bacterium]